MIENSLEGVKELLREGRMNAADIAAKSMKGQLKSTDLMQANVDMVRDLLMAGHIEAAKQVVDHLSLTMPIPAVEESVMEHQLTDSVEDVDVDTDKTQQVSSSSSSYTPSSPSLAGFFKSVNLSPRETGQSIAMNLYNSYFGDHKNGANEVFYKALKAKVPTVNDQLNILQEIKSYVELNHDKKYQQGYKRAFFGVKSGELKQRDRQLDQLDKLENSISNNLSRQGLSTKG